MSEIISTTDSNNRKAAQLSRYFRRFTEVLTQIEDTRRFGEGLQRLIRQFPNLESACLNQLDHSADEQDFKEYLRKRHLTLPLLSDGGFRGVLSIPDKRQIKIRLGAEDLHLLSAMASLAGTLLDISHKMRSESRKNSWFDPLMEAIPAGLVRVSTDRKEIKLNTLAKKYLRVADTPDSRHLDLLLEQAENCSKSFHLKIEESLYYVKPVDCPDPAGNPGSRIVLLYDLTREREQILEFILRETYRCKWRQSPLTLLTIQSPADGERLMAALPAFEKSLDSEDGVGPFDAQSLAVVLNGKKPVEALKWIRDQDSFLPPGELSMGMQHLDDSISHGTDLIDIALSKLEERREFLKPTLLLVDRYPPVLDALDMALSPRFKTVKAPTRNDALRLLREIPVEGIFLERSPGSPEDTGDMVNIARRENPHLKIILTSPDEASPSFGKSDPPHLLTLQKPFAARDVESVIRRAFPASFN